MQFKEELKRVWQRAQTKLSLYDPCGLKFILKNDDPIPKDIQNIEFTTFNVLRGKPTLFFHVTMSNESREGFGHRFVIPLDELKALYPKYQNDKFRDSDILTDAIDNGYDEVRNTLTAIQNLETQIIGLNHLIAIRDCNVDQSSIPNSKLNL